MSTIDPRNKPDSLRAARESQRIRAGLDQFQENARRFLALVREARDLAEQMQQEDLFTVPWPGASPEDLILRRALGWLYRDLPGMAWNLQIIDTFSEPSIPFDGEIAL